MASESRGSVHEQHVYDYFNAMEKYVRMAVPQLIADYLTLMGFRPWKNGKNRCA